MLKRNMGSFFIHDNIASREAWIMLLIYIQIQFEMKIRLIKRLDYMKNS